MINFNLQLAHVGEETEEHLEAGNTQTQISPPPSQEKQTVDIGFYFVGAVIILAIIIFLVVKFLRKNRKSYDQISN